MRWGNAMIKSLSESEAGIQIEAELMLDDKDFKSTKKINWLSSDSPNCMIDLVEYDHLIKVKKIDEDVDFMSVINENTKYKTRAVADPAIKNI